MADNLGGKRISLKGLKLCADTKHMVISLTEVRTFGTLSNREEGEGCKFGISEVRNRLILQRTEMQRGGTSTTKSGGRVSRATTKSAGGRGTEGSHAIDMGVLL